jgi:anti-sigma factor RsiW
MSDPSPSVTEGDLHAFVDWQLDADRRSVVEQHLRATPADAAMVAAYSAQREALRAALADMDQEPIPARLNPYAIQQSIASGRQMWRAAAAVVLAFGLGGGGGWALHDRMAPPAASTITLLTEEAFANHAVFTADRRRPTELGAEQREDLAKWVSNRINRPVAPPDLSVAGYKYLGGRLAATPHGPAGMFMYQNEQGVRLTVFVRPVATQGSLPFETIAAGSLEGCAWAEKGMGYTVVAPLPAADVQRVAAGVRQGLADAT